MTCNLPGYNYLGSIEAPHGMVKVYRNAHERKVYVTFGPGECLELIDSDNTMRNFLRKGIMLGLISSPEGDAIQRWLY